MPTLKTPRGWTLREWREAYASGGLTPRQALGALRRSLHPSDPAWISLADEAQWGSQLAGLEARLQAAEGDREALPLYGIPFAVKDNIDAAGWVTTAACPAFAYTPAQDAPVVAALLAAGAVLVGKTNLDQFATGLVGLRSPYGAVPNAFDARYVAGGSSAGSASAVARGLVPFSLGTDTAGSGRVPAAFHNLVGLKPTRGAVSTRGVVPTCRSLDCVSILALTLEDAEEVARLIGGYDEQDAYSRAAPPAALTRRSRPRRRFGVPQDPQWFGDERQARAYARALERVRELNVELQPVDFQPMYEMSDLLYG
ncbi:MAG TPA: amidase family protein, partial [bacterium]|nr:amidase family protein [bacterium]